MKNKFEENYVPVETKGSSQVARAAFREISGIRRPLVLIRGKDLTKEELIKVILSAEPFFASTSEYDMWYCGGIRNIFHRRGFGWLDGWFSQDGRIYSSYYLPKYPEVFEYLPYLKFLAEVNPFLDMTFTVIDSDESYCYSCPYVSVKGYGGCEVFGNSDYCLAAKHKEFAKFVMESSEYKRRGERSGIEVTDKDKAEIVKNDHYLNYFINNFDFWYVPERIGDKSLLTVHLSGGKLKLYCGKDSSYMYTKYNSLYGDFRYMITQESNFYSCMGSNGVSYVKFTREFLKELCIISGRGEEHYNMIASRHLYSNYLTNEEVLITSDWLKEQYDKYFKGTVLDYDKLKNSTGF